MNSIYDLDSSPVDSYSSTALYDFSNLVFTYFKKHQLHKYAKIIILCIGSDRSTGDSLGPLVGYKLKSVLSIYENIQVIGTLDDPVHAKNLEEKTEYINKNFINPFILAIDASLGNLDKVGYINIKSGSLKPGLGVNKKLPHIGNVSITGVVNIGGIMEYMVLQNTRLSIVMNMADIISKSIRIALSEYFRDKLEKISKF